MPIATSVPASPARPVRADAPSVLVVDDVKSTRDRLCRILGAGGYAVLEAGDGQDALRTLATSSHVDAILLDLVMPSMNGWEFRESQLRDSRLAHIPTVVITVRELAEHERYGLRIGSATVIQKPFEDGEVLDSLARIIVNPRPAPASADNRWTTRDGKPLLWSKRGSVACALHAPPPDSQAWKAEGWAWIPRFAGKNKIEYACQQCEGGPIRHTSGHRETIEA